MDSQPGRSETSPEKGSFRPFNFIKGLFQEKIRKVSEKEFKPIEYAKVWEQVFESVHFIEIEDDVVEITNSVQQYMRQSNLNASIMGSSISLLGDNNK